MSVNKCPFCDSQEYKIIQDNFRDNYSIKAYQCGNCDLIFSSKLFETTQSDLNNFYEEQYMKDYYDGNKAKILGDFNDKLPYQFERIKRLGNIIKKDYHILDIGCGPGYFLDACRSITNNLVGIEKNRIERKFVSDELNIKCYEDIDNLEERKFDLIVLNQILEHIHNPKKFIEQNLRLLKKGGNLVIEVPSATNTIVSLYNLESFKKFWYQEPHLYYYSANTMKNLLQEFVPEIQIDIKVFQETSFINHYNWVKFNSKTKNRSEAISDNFPLKTENDINGKLEELYKDFNINYKKILEENGFGDILLAIVKT